MTKHKTVSADEAARFAEACQQPTKAGDEAFSKFIRLFDRAGSSDQIGNAEWIAHFYPLLVEINAEIDEAIELEGEQAFYAGDQNVYQYA